jgi:hypothetical protein
MGSLPNKKDEVGSRDTFFYAIIRGLRFPKLPGKVWSALK